MATAVATRVETRQQRRVAYVVPSVRRPLAVALIVEPKRRPAARALDLAIGLPLLAAALPSMVLLAIATKLTSPGPVFTRSARLGQGGRPFHMVQFRTVHNETAGAVAPTRLGRFLARTGLADLPILWNVVAGSMSLVGPRPVTAAAASHPSMMGSPTLAVKPGVTGPWRVAVFADGRARAHADRGYAASCSLLGDLSLLARTPKALLWPIRQ